MSIDPTPIDGDRYVGATPTQTKTNAQSNAKPASDLDGVSSTTDTQTTWPVEEAIGQESVTLGDELAEAIGLGLTRNNPVWTSAALDRIRELQHVLMKCAFALPQGDRGPVLAGVKSLELSVMLRLRLDEAIYAEQQAATRGSIAVESKAPSNASKSEIMDNRAIAA